MSRIPISKIDIRNGKFDKDKKYVHKGDLYLIEDLPNFSSPDINILVKGDLSLQELSFLNYLSENIVVKGTIYIRKCPLLKTISIPFKNLDFTELFLYDDQYLTTIISEKQFLSLRSVWIYSLEVSKIKLIETYEEYYSIIEPTLEKNNLMKICNF